MEFMGPNVPWTNGPQSFYQNKKIYKVYEVKKEHQIGWIRLNNISLFFIPTMGAEKK